jgi:hypothetical protein
MSVARKKKARPTLPRPGGLSTFTGRQNRVAATLARASISSSDALAPFHPAESFARPVSISMSVDVQAMFPLSCFS